MKNISDFKIYSATQTIFFALLIFMPLARGGVHLWTHAVAAIGVLLLLTTLSLEKINSGQPKFKRTELFFPILALLSWVLLSLLLSSSKPDSIESLSRVLVYVSIYYITIHIVRTRSQQRALVYLLISIGLFLSYFGFIKLLGFNPFSWWHYAGLNENNNFLTSTFGNHNHLAGYLEMVVPLLLCLFLVRTRRGATKYYLLFFVVTLLAAHTLALSRGGWISILVSLLFMGSVLYSQRRFRRKKFLLMIVVSAIFLLFFVLAGTNMLERILTITDRDTVVGLNGRSIAWQGVFEMIAAHPILGSGPGSFATIFTQYQPPGMTARFFYAHNDYLQYIAELGLPIIIFMAWFLYVIFKKGFKKLQSPSRQKWGITLGAMTGIVAILIHSFVDFNLHIPANAMLFTVLVALVMGDVKSRKKKGKRAKA